MAAITFSGLATGLDSKTIIDGLIAAEKVPLTRLQSQETDLQNEISVFGSLSPLLSDIATKAQALETTSSFRAFTAGTSDDSVVTASATGSAAKGTYDVEVVSLAQNAIEISNGFANRDSTSVGHGTLKLTVGGVVTNIAIGSSSDTLQGVASAINGSGAEVTASVINDGGSSPYRLVITANDGGDENTVAIDVSGLHDPGQALSFTETRQAKSASLKINGIAVKADSNTVADAVDGVTFTLKKQTAPGEKVTIDVSSDTAALKKKIQDFVGAYNSLSSQISRFASRDATTGATGLLFGDFTTGLIQRKLQAVVASSVTTSENVYASLSAIGIKTGKNGQLSVSDDDLTKALDANPDAVIGLFVDGDGGLAKQIADFASSASGTDGIIQGRQDGLRANIKSIDASIQRMQDHLDRMQQDLTTRFSALESYASKFQGLTNLFSTTTTTK